MRKIPGGILAALLSSSAVSCAQGDAQKFDAHIKVNASKILNGVSPYLAGSCIEDVNHEIYGGLYDQKIYGESFEEPPPSPKLKGWKTLGGDWKVNGESIVVAADQGAKVINDTPAFDDGSVSTELKFPGGNGGNAGLLVRVSDAGVGADTFNGYEVSLNPTAGRVILGKHRHNWQALQSAPVTFSARDWTHLKVQLDGARIRVFVGETTDPAIDFTDPEAPLLSGTFALRTWGSDAAFRKITAAKNGEMESIIPVIAPNSNIAAVSGQWDSVQTGTANAQFQCDDINPYNGDRSQKIRRGAGSGEVGIANRGLNRWGIALKRGQALGGRLYLRGQDIRGAVTLSLQSVDGKQVYASQKITKVGTSWAKYPISLKPSGDDANARFTVTLDQPGTLWVDQATLTGTGAAQFKGLPIRADVAKAIQQQGIKFLRYGGTMVNAPEYRWKNMMGDPDKRPPYRGHWYPYSSNGFGVEDFVRFCRAADIEPAFAINIEETAQDVSDLTEYLNGATSTYWGKRRAENGHPAPYKVRWIEIGNEEVLGGNESEGYDHYIERFNALSAAIHAKDPNIQLVCSAWWRPDSPSIEKVFHAIDGKAAFWDLHVGGDNLRTGAEVDRDLGRMQQLFKTWNPQTSLKCVIFEENGNTHNLQRALGHALNINAARKHGDFVLVSCPANALQPDGENDNGWDQGQIFLNAGQVWSMPPFYSAQMANDNALPQRVESNVDGDLDVTATRSDDGKTVVLHVVNASDTPKSVQISIDGLMKIKAQGQVWTLTGALDAVNSATSSPIQPIQSVLAASPQFSHLFAAHSYTVLRLQGGI